MNSSNYFYKDTCVSHNFILNTSTFGDITSTINLTDTNSMWFPYYMESTWLPYYTTPYKPEFHIKLGYKN